MQHYAKRDLFFYNKLYSEFFEKGLLKKIISSCFDAEESILENQFIKFDFKNINFNLLPFLSDELKTNFCNLNFDSDDKSELVKKMFDSLDIKQISEISNSFDINVLSKFNENSLCEIFNFLLNGFKVVDNNLINTLQDLFNEENKLFFYDKDYYNFIITLNNITDDIDYDSLYDILKHFADNTNLLKTDEQFITPLSN